MAAGNAGGQASVVWEDISATDPWAETWAPGETERVPYPIALQMAESLRDRLPPSLREPLRGLTGPQTAVILAEIFGRPLAVRTSDEEMRPARLR